MHISKEVLNSTIRGKLFLPRVTKTYRIVVSNAVHKITVLSVSAKKGCQKCIITGRKYQFHWARLIYRNQFQCIINGYCLNSEKFGIKNGTLQSLISILLLLLTVTIKLCVCVCRYEINDFRNYLQKFINPMHLIVHTELNHKHKIQ